MAEIKIGGTPTYTIPLDSLDLAYLSKYIRSTGAEKPLWTKKWLDGESEYCQVQIHTPLDHNDNCYSEPSDAYKCLTCNTLVPTSCSEKHNSSERHGTSKKIYQKILENISNQMEINAINKDQNINKAVYYCEPCSKIIKIKNKLKHETSTHHEKSIKELNIINGFFDILKENKMYNDYEADENVLADGIDVESDYFKVNFDDTKDDNGQACRMTFDSDDDSFYHNLSVAPETSDITIKQHPNETKKENFEEYLKEMIKKYNLGVNLPVIDGESIYIVAPNGDTVKVSREHFHSYKDLQNGVYCQLCNTWISQDNKWSHDISERHVRNIFRPVNDKFARLVDTTSSHCVPCNDIVPTGLSHDSLNDNHKAIMKNSKTPNTGKTFCDDCNLYIDTCNYPVHLNSKKHLNIFMKQNSIHKLGNNDNFCRLCNLTIPTYAIKVHVGTKKHVANKNNNTSKINNNNNASNEVNNKNNATIKINNKNDTPIVDNDSKFCKICKVNVPGGGMEIHIDGKPHKKKVDQLSSENRNGITSKGNKLENCAKPGSSNTARSGSTNKSHDSVVNSNYLPTTSSSYGNGAEHEIKKMSAYYHLLQFTDKSETKVRCEICSVIIVFGERNIIEHMESNNHIDNVIKQKMEKYCKLLFFTDNDKTKVQCEICDVTVPYLQGNIIEHMEGKNHKAAEHELLKFHVLTKDSTDCVCQCCDVHTVDFLDHINSRNHTLQFQEKYQVDKTEMRKYVYDEIVKNSVSRRHRERHRNLLKHNNIYKLDDFNYYCCICQIKLGRISEIDHVLGERHMSKMEKVEK